MPVEQLLTPVVQLITENDDLVLMVVMVVGAVIAFRFVRPKTRPGGWVQQVDELRKVEESEEAIESLRKVPVIKYLPMRLLGLLAMILNYR